MQLLWHVFTLACKQEKSDRTLKEVCTRTNFLLTDIGRVLTKIKKLKLYKPPKAKKSLNTGPAAMSMSLSDGTSSSDVSQSAVRHMDRFCSALKLSREVSRAATYIAERATQLSVSTANPATIAATAIYLACQLSTKDEYRRTYKQISTIATIAPTTIRSTYKADIYPHRSTLLPPDYAAPDIVRDLPDT